MDARLRGKIEALTERCEELSAMLCDAEIVADKPRFLELSREHASLMPVAESFSALLEAERQLEETRELLEDPDMAELARGDADALLARIEELGRDLTRKLLPKDPNDGRNAILEIRAGTGGDEAGLFAGDLWRMYSRYAERGGWKVENVEFAEAPAGGFKEISGLIKGRGVWAKLKYERGVHRVQRVPVTESQGRIHTSAATVALMPEAEEIDVHIDPSDIKFEKMRASGAGGQHVNTTDSAVRLTHIPTGIAVHVQQEKSQTKNREIAMTRLRSRLLAAEIERADAERAAERRAQVGSGDRSEKIRTYNFPQDRITDHRVNLTRHNLPSFLDGDMDDVIDALRTHDEAERLERARHEP